LEARRLKAQNVKKNSAKGVGTIGGETQAWMDRVGQSGMSRLDVELSMASRRTLDSLRAMDHSPNLNPNPNPNWRTLDSLRAMDHSLNSSNHDLILSLVKNVVAKGKGNEDGGGAILIFMSGFQEIKDLVTSLEHDAVLGDKKSFLILPLHSELTTGEQKEVFRRPPEKVDTFITRN